MLVYLNEIINRLKEFSQEYSSAAELSCRAAIEYRECRNGWLVLESERFCIEAMLEYWLHSPQLPFADQDKVSVALTAVKGLRRKEQSCT